MHRDRRRILRTPVELFPESATEVNIERLPERSSLDRMELNYRELNDSLSPPELAYSWTGLFLPFGVSYLWLLIRFPATMTFIRIEAAAVDGLTIVLFGVLISAGLCFFITFVFLVSKAVRVVWLCLSAIGVVGLLGSAFDVLLPASFGCGLVAVFAVRVLRQKVVQFHEGWLLADQRVDKEMRRQCLALLNRGDIGWSRPRFQRLAFDFMRFLRYQAVSSGAAGVWSPSLTALERLSYVAFVGAAILATTTFAFSAAERSGFFSGLGALVPSGGFLLSSWFWIAGKLEALDEAFKMLLKDDDRTSWQQSVDRLIASEHVARDPITGAAIREADHFFVGIEPWQRFPVLLHKLLLYEHTSILGRSGSGKTSMGMMQILIQAIRFRNDNRDGDHGKMPIVIIDLKGDEVMFQTAKAEAEARGQKFRFFTLEKGKPSHYFNPFTGFDGKNRSVPQLVQLILDSLGLNHGVGYGRSYFSHRSRFFLSEALKEAKGVTTFKELYKILQDMYRDRKADFRDAFELLSVIELLTHYKQLVTTKAMDADADADTIQMDRVLEEREVVYFWLPSALESVSVREVAKLVLLNLRTASQNRRDEEKPLRRMFLFIDECQKLAGENFQEVLQQARSAGISVVLANQSLSDLRTPDVDLRPVVRTNTRVKMFFSVAEPEEMRMLSDFSGEEIRASEFDETEQVRPRLSAMELLAISDHPKRLLLHVNGGSGYTQFGGVPIPVETDWPISKTLADLRLTMPWPTLSAPSGKTVAISLEDPQDVDLKRRKAPARFQAQIDLLSQE
ncbi:hypothetical protein F183_A21090 [Bryobacterales bacterium F-183]|nr:hypothetical protein F183_A21090 [Bryobacterales bacterium F-183]